MTQEERALLIAIGHVLLRQTGDPGLGEALERLENGPVWREPLPHRDYRGWKPLDMKPVEITRVPPAVGEAQPASNTPPEDQPGKDGESNV
jgi:hypothetical protein